MYEPESTLRANIVHGDPEECWIWTGPIDGRGYGRFTVDKRRVAAHRFMYERQVGPIPTDLQIDHLCRQKRCVNPLHLQPVTPKENVGRGLSGHFQRRKTHCPKGHLYTPENVRIATWLSSSQGPRWARVCRICENQKFRRYEQRRNS